MMEAPVRVLLVEDNIADVYLIRKALIHAGLIFELTIIEDGGQAMAFVRGDREFASHPVPDIAIIDLSLPKNDGIQVLEAIRATERFDRMAVLVASSSATQPLRLKEEHLRIARYITKPPDLEDFLQIGTVVKEILLAIQARSATP